MFRPLGFDIEASVYDEGNRVADIIGSSGISKKFHYDRASYKVGESDETGRTTKIRVQNFLQNSSILVASKFGWYVNWEGFERWDAKDDANFSVLLGGFAHNGGKSKLDLRETPTSFLIRFEYNMENGNDGVMDIDIGGRIISIGKALNLVSSKLSTQLPPEGELVLLSDEGGRVCVWVNGGIMLDELLSPKLLPKLSLTLTGRLSLSSFFLMPYPQIKITYHNGLNEPIQEVILESSKSVIVSQILYDGIGRPFLKTKATRVHKTSPDGSLMKFHLNFVTRFNEDAKQLEGEVSDLNPSDENFPYYMDEYEDYPGGSVLSRGLPGKYSHLGGVFGTRTKVNVSVPFIRNLFPPALGFTYKTRAGANGKQTFWVYKEALLRAIYILAPMFDHRLTTYDYDGKNLVRILPPSYHKAVDTFSRLTEWDTLPASQQLAQFHGTFFAYNGGQLMSKTNREEGTIHFLYDKFGRQRFRVCEPYGSENFTKIIYTYFDQLTGLLSTSGLFTRPISHLTELEPFLDDDIPLPQSNMHEFQRFSHGDSSYSDENLKQIFTNNGGKPVIEEITSNIVGEITEKTVVFLPAAFTQALRMKISKSRDAEGTEIVCYPVVKEEINSKRFCLLRKYNSLGQLVSITEGNGISFEFKYDADGRILREEYPDNVREYRYDSPGYLKTIKDSFLTLSLSYEGEGYTQSAQGSGIMTSFNLQHHWKKNMNMRKLSISENPAMNSGMTKDLWTTCLKGLRRTGYLTPNLIPTGKTLILSAEHRLPLQCRGNTGLILSAILEEKMPPREHGYKVDYGSHKEILRAKYYTPGQDASNEPLQPHTFHKRIHGISYNTSISIWNSLVSSGFLIVNQPTKNIRTHIGRLSEFEIFKQEKLEADLKEFEPNAEVYSASILQLLSQSILYDETSIAYSAFQERLLEWSGLIDSNPPEFLVEKEKALSRKIFDILVARNYFTSIFSSEFTAVLNQYGKYVVDIAKILLEHEQNSLGNHPFDMDVLDIDANGNRQVFQRGHWMFDVTYLNDSINQIKEFTRHLGSKEETFSFDYDSDGNVIRAEHKNITSVKYHPIIKRPVQIELNDRIYLEFHYDAQGERVVKQVFSSSGYLTKETVYIRDERARVMTERTVTRDEETDSIVLDVITHFIYGPRGLIAFTRDGELFGVTSDHLGSVRVVYRRGEVVASYDYMPYGEVLKCYVADPKGDLTYRFSGKEWDEETGLYNFHARLYDPTLGRFFQTDPLWQYSSPYIYLGNSPFSLADPDGEEPVTLIVLGVIGAFAGGYLGGAAINNQWNPADWDFNDPGTYFGIGGGAVAGALLPVGFAGSVGVIGGLTTGVGASAAIGSLGTAGLVAGVYGTIFLGTGFAYLSTSAGNGKWNPAEWEWDRPHTTNALFIGFSIGSTIPAGMTVVNNLAIKLAGESTKLRAVLISANFVAGGGMAYGLTASAMGEVDPTDWDWTSPALYSSLTTGMYSGYGLPTLLTGSVKGISKLLSSSKLLNINAEVFKTALKNSKSPIYKAIGGLGEAYLMGAMANEEFDPTAWNFKTLTTYQGMLNGAFMGKSIGLLVDRLLGPPPKPILLVKLDYKRLESLMKNKLAEFIAYTFEKFKLMLDLSAKYNFTFKVINAPKGTTSVANKGSQQFIRQLEQKWLEQRTISTDRKMTGIPCSGGGRVRRVLPTSCLLSSSSASKKTITSLKSDPPSVLKDKPITTLNLDAGAKFLRNNEIVHLTLLGIKGNPSAYALTPVATSTQNSFAAYYLGTYETINIPAFPEGDPAGPRRLFNRLVITPELGGCSLYVKYNNADKSITIFHHFRKGVEPLLPNHERKVFQVYNERTKTLEEFTDVLSYEEYAKVSSDPEKRMFAATTAMIQYDYNTMSWNFLTQMISYYRDAKLGELTNIEVEGFKSRLIGGIPWGDGTIVQSPYLSAPRPPGS